jgi:hypothetical protein
MLRLCSILVCLMHMLKCTKSSKRALTPASATQITRVPVATSAHIVSALKLLRQQLTLNELFSSCFQRDLPSPLDQNDQQTQAGGATTAATRIVEVSAMAPSVLFLHIEASQGGMFQLVNMETKVELGGTVSVKLRCKGPAPCSDEYATEVLATCRNVPMALRHIFGN